jgi:chromosome segregation ATPase
MTLDQTLGELEGSSGITTLDHEKFNTAKEIADINIAIAEARTTLAALGASREAFLTGREQEAIARIKKVLDESKDVLDDIDRNHHELSSYRVELKHHADVLRTWHDQLLADMETLKETFARADAALEKKRASVGALVIQLRTERTQVAEDRKQLKREEQQIAEAWRQIKDRREAFERAWAELASK